MGSPGVPLDVPASQPPPSNTPLGEGDGKDDPNRKKAAARKRTKTGCLTCRKRRIKCDEARPICNNCTKSKRLCEGYSQRVIFKDPIGAFHGGTFGPLVYPPESSQHPFLPPTGHQQLNKPASQAPPLATIAPKPHPAYDFQSYPATPYGQTFQPQPAGPGAESSVFNFNDTRYGPHASSSGAPLASPSSPSHRQRPSPESEPPYLPSPAVEEGTFDYDDMERRDQKRPARSPEGSQHVDGAVEVVSEPNAPGGSGHETTTWEHVYSDDDDASMGDSEDDYEGIAREHLYGNLVHSHMDGPVEGVGTKMRSFSAFAEDDFLTTYIPNAANSPLNDAKTAALFWHFVNVTGPSMSLYERHPFDHGDKAVLSHPAPKANQNIWTYTFPIVSFHHPALLQSILAIGALQIAKLQNIPPTAAMKHYHLAIRRIARNVRSPSRRTQPATLASTLLLAYFEVWNSDHTKWCQHLLGARLLLREIPFRKMTRNILPLKRARRSLLEQERNRPLDPFFGSCDDPVKHDLDDIDVGFVSRLVGHHVQYEDDSPLSGLYYTDRDIEHYEHLRDLFWWYLKMDVYHGLLSGDRPFMEYEHWTQCPPRAPKGKLEAIYGSYDHLVLVMGRLMTFAANDLPRKRKAMQMYGMMGGPPGPGAGRGQHGGGPPGPPPRAAPPGGAHAPHGGGPPGGFPGGPPGGAFPGAPGMGPPGMGIPPGGIPPGMMPPHGMPPGGMPGGMPAGPPPGSMPPMFPGMLPTSGEVSLPMGFSPPRDATPPKEGPEDIDLESATVEAMREWEAIRESFELIRAHFGPEFEPLGPEYADRRDSPFGPTLQYRTFSVAGVWLNYYMGLIHLARTDPRMPPAAMIAQGIQARQTAPYAVQIGRIAAGLCDDLTNVTEVSTLVGAALVESGLPLFVGGIQSQDDTQRHWIIRRLHDIARLTGWQSARQIAEGCESGWRKAAEMGKGPPYSRDPSLYKEIPKSVWVFPRKISTRIDELERDDQMLVVARSERASYAIGLLSVEKELERLDLD